MDQDDLQRCVLRVLADGADSRLGHGKRYLVDSIKKAAPDARFTRSDIQQTVWSLVSQGLAYIDFSQPAPGNWALRLTAAGSAAVADEEINPNDPAGYLARLIKDVPGISPTVKKYATEALGAYTARLYLSCTVMLGVASEAAFLELAEAFTHALSGNHREKFSSIFHNPKQAYVAKFNEFRKRVEPLRGQLPEALQDGMDLWLNSVLDLLRVYRNDAGHPKGKTMDRDDCFINLRMFARYVHKMYVLKEFCQEAGESLGNAG